MRKSLTSSNRANLMPLTASQCRGIVGGDPGMVLAGGGGFGGVFGSSSFGSGGIDFGGSSGGYSAGDMAMAAAGIGYAGGPMVSVTVGPPLMPDIALGGFDIWLGRTAGASAGAAAGAFVAGAMAGAEVGWIAGPIGVVVVAAVGGLVGTGAQMLLQHAANEEAYEGIPDRLRHRRQAP
jgi:hypothetical protein